MSRDRRDGRERRGPRRAGDDRRDRGALGRGARGGRREARLAGRRSSTTTPTPQDGPTPTSAQEWPWCAPWSSRLRRSQRSRERLAGCSAEPSGGVSSVSRPMGRGTTATGQAGVLHQPDRCRTEGELGRAAASVDPDHEEPYLIGEVQQQPAGRAVPDDVAHHDVRMLPQPFLDGGRHVDVVLRRPSSARRTGRRSMSSAVKCCACTTVSGSSMQLRLGEGEVEHLQGVLAVVDTDRDAATRRRDQVSAMNDHRAAGMPDQRHGRRTEQQAAQGSPASRTHDHECGDRRDLRQHHAGIPDAYDVVDVHTRASAARLREDLLEQLGALAQQGSPVGSGRIRGTRLLPHRSERVDRVDQREGATLDPGLLQRPVQRETGGGRPVDPDDDGLGC